MRLVSCRIDGFGKYQNAKWDFSKGLNVYSLANGEGKTTLATFLRAMLYGMPTDRGDSYGTRGQYYPFQGGAYGGSLRVEWRGKVYEIARSFDKKSDKKDTLSVVDERGKACDALGEVPGLTLFGLTEEAFLRTSYITWKQTDIGLGYGIGQRLGGLAADTSPLTLENALKRLDEHKKTYHSDRRSLGAFTGLIPETQEKVEVLRQEINHAEEVKKWLTDARTEYDRVYAAEQSLADEIEKMQAAETLRARWDNYRVQLSAAEDEERKAAALAAAYPAGFPTEDEIAKWKVSHDELQRIRLQKQVRSFAKAELLAEKEEKFAAGVPSQERMERTELMIDEFLTAKAAEENAAATLQKTNKTKGWLLILILAVAAGLLVAGVLLVGSILPFGIGLIVGGVLLLLADMLLYIKGLAVAAPALPTGLSKRVQDMGTRLVDIFAEYGISATDMPMAYHTLKAEIESLMSLRKEKAAYDKQTEELCVREQACLSVIQEGLRRYQIGEDGWLDAGRNAKAYATAVEQAAEKRARAEQYRVDYGLQEQPQAVVGLDEKKIAQRGLQENIRVLCAKIEEYEKTVAESMKLRLQMKEEQERLQEYRLEKERAEKAIAALKTADENLKERYLSPMRTSFLRYAKKMGVEWAESVALGENLEVRFEAQGALRRAENLSDGQRALTALCMRLALMENLYEGEMPFCILDDPFVHLDEKHFAEVAAGVRALSNEMQILYFTCHDARKI